MDVKRLGYKIVSDLLKKREYRIQTMLSEGVEDTADGAIYRCAAHLINTNDNKRTEITTSIDFKRDGKGNLEPQPFTVLMGETTIDFVFMDIFVNGKLFSWEAIDILDHLNVVGLELVGDAVRDRFPGFHSGRIYKMRSQPVSTGIIQFEFLGYYRKGLQTEPAPNDGIGEIAVSARIEFQQNGQQWHPVQFPTLIAEKIYEYLPLWDEENKKYGLQRMPTAGKNPVIDPSSDLSPEEEE